MTGEAATFCPSSNFYKGSCGIAAGICNCKNMTWSGYCNPNYGYFPCN
jgi:hypothetical protein